MTAPSITYGHGHLYDGDTVSDLTEVPGACTGTATIDYGDLLNLNVTVSAGDKVYYWYNTANLGLDTGTYTRILWRYKTSDSSIKAKIALEFDDASNQTVLEETSSTTWSVGNATISPPASTVLDHVLLCANQATGDVWYDFVLVHKNVFTFPFFDNLSVDFENRYADIEVPSRVGDVTQYLGLRNATVQMDGKMDANTGWSSPKGMWLYRALLDSWDDKWQWFTSDLINCKLTPRRFHIAQRKDEGIQRNWSFEGKMYSLSSGSDWGSISLEWIGL